MNNIPNTKDLTKEAPRSPYETLGGFAILPRTIDKCRAVIAGTPGEYHFNCPLDQALFSFKGTDAEAFKAYVAEGHTDEEIAEFVKTTGNEKSEEEIAEWSSAFRSDFSYTTNDKAEWFKGECARLGLDAEKTTLFDMLEEDDKVSFA
mgnify:CR=1 FL=1